MTIEKIILRHTISGVSESFPAEYARDLLADPELGKVLVEVDSEKPEVFSRSYVVDSDGKRYPADDED